ncbi:MAG: hypothetical protein O7G85_07225, partial [Planctomycetota bacterium]|nr:hypothetical protein [Planctomycetota bacterium]
KEFTSRNIRVLLGDRYQEYANGIDKSSISTSLARLRNLGEIVVKLAGSGRRPASYIKSKKDDNGNWKLGPDSEGGEA